MWEIHYEEHKARYIQIMELISRYIKTGKLQPGQRLPSERKLADLFQVNRSTVVHALDELVSLGILVRKRGSGTFVNEGKWGLYTEPRIDWRGYLSQNVLGKQHPFVEKVQDYQASALDLYTGDLPPELVPTFKLPTLNWQEFIAEEMQQDMLGYKPLKQAIAERLMDLYQMPCPQDECLITSGGQQALFLILQTLLVAGDSVAIELPSFFYALPLFQASGVRLYGIPFKDSGLDLEKLEELILTQKIKLVMVNPNFQNPTGNVMGTKQRQELVDLCRNYHIPIVEDDVFAEFSFLPKEATKPLKVYDPENVLYIGSLSKILGTTTKIGWLSAPSQVIEQIAQARLAMDFSLSIFPQVLGTYALTAREFPSQRQRLLTKIQQQAQLYEEWATSQTFWQVKPFTGGYYSYIGWAGKKMTTAVSNKMLELGLLAVPGELFGDSQNGLRINITRLQPEMIQQFSDCMLQLEELVKK